MTFDVTDQHARSRKRVNTTRVTYTALFVVIFTNRNTVTIRASTTVITSLICKQTHKLTIKVSTSTRMADILWNYIHNAVQLTIDRLKGPHVEL